MSRGLFTVETNKDVVFHSSLIVYLIGAIVCMVWFTNMLGVYPMILPMWFIVLIISKRNKTLNKWYNTKLN